MTEEFLELRKKIHKNDVRFDASYRAKKGDLVDGNVISIRRNGVLEGYAVWTISKGRRLHLKGLVVTELCASQAKPLIDLLDKIIELGIKKKVDFILLRRFYEPHDKIFSRLGFMNLRMNVLMPILINLEQLLKPLSEPGVTGKSIKLQIREQVPLFVIVGKNRFSISTDIENPDLIISTDSKVFLRLFFNRTSIIREFLKKTISFSCKRRFLTALKFFNMIKQKQWYFPDADT